MRYSEAMNKILVLTLVLVTSFALSGCTLFSTAETGQQQDINVTLSGVLSKGSGELFLLKTADKGIVSLHNAGATLDSYVGKSVTVVGQYSGSTLYVDKVQ